MGFWGAEALGDQRQSQDQKAQISGFPVCVLSFITPIREDPS